MIREKRPRITTSGRALWLCSLCMFLVGCSGGYQTIPILTSTQENARNGEEPADLEPGDQIRLTHEDGTRTKGKYAGIRDHSLVMNKAEAAYSEADGFDEIRGPETVSYAQTTEFPLAEITLLEKYNAKTGENLAIGAAIVGFLGMMVYAMDHTMDDFDFED